MPLTYIQPFQTENFQGYQYSENPDPLRPVIGLRTAVNLALLRFGDLCSPFHQPDPPHKAHAAPKQNHHAPAV